MKSANGMSPIHGHAAMLTVHIVQILPMMAAVFMRGNQLKMSNLKIESLLSLIHEENKVILTYLLAVVCYPKDYDRCIKENLENWDKAYQRIMRIDDEKEQCGKNDNSRAADSD